MKSKLALWLVLVAAGGVWGQERPLSPLLREAQEAGSLERVLGARYFRIDRGAPTDAPPREVAVFEGALEGELLTCTVRFLGQGAELRYVYRFTLEGGLEGLEFTVSEEGLDVVARGGAPEGGRLVVEVMHPGAEEGEEHVVAYTERALPFLVAAGYVPAWIGAGLPGHLSFQTFQGEDLHLDEGLSTLRVGTTPLPTPEGPAVDVTYLTPSGNQVIVQVVSEGERVGSIHRITIDDLTVLTPMTEEDALPIVEKLGG